VPGVTKAETAALRVDCDESGAHPALLRLARRALSDPRIRELCSGDEEGLRRAGLWRRIHRPHGAAVRVERLECLGRDGGGQVAGGMTAHAVEHDKEAEIGAKHEGVLVDGATAAHLGAAGGFQVQSS
jgi:hypothetical protein